jgi:hypothetical protein
VHLPELALRGGDLRGLGGGLGVAKQMAPRVRAKHEPHVRHPRQQLLDVPVGVPAERAGEVPVFDQRDIRLRRTADVIARADGLGEEGRMLLVEVAH